MVKQKILLKLMVIKFQDHIFLNKKMYILRNNAIIKIE